MPGHSLFLFVPNLIRSSHTSSPCQWVCAMEGSSAQAGAPAHTSSSSAANESGSHAVPQKGRRPRLFYAQEHETPSSISLDTIGVVHSPYLERFGTPRQPNVVENTLGNAAQPASIELFDGQRFELALRGLEEFEFCWVISFFHLNQGWNPLITPPRGPRKKQGVFATRSPHRPNSIGLSCMRITGVDTAKRTIHFMGCDLIDGTAVLDIKPYVPYADSFPNAKAGWLDTLRQDMKAPDRLSYFPPPKHLTQPLQEPCKTQPAAIESASENASQDSELPASQNENP